MEGFIEITLKRSGIGRPAHHKAILKALGLTKLHKTVKLRDTPAVWGMVKRVCHLVDVKKTGE
tara:strand:- start:278 stop:466 length:189 start_codon:yes stop_codon:yes gene_type:complete